MVVRLRLLTLASLLFAGLISSCSDSGGSGGGLGSLADPDADGLPTRLEMRLGSDPNDPDDPFVGGNLDVVNADGPSGDGITDGVENYLISLGAVRPVVANGDLDGDDIPDYLEVRIGSSPTSSEDPFAFGSSDILNEFGPPGDDIRDGLERQLIKSGARSPVTLVSDTDGDNLSDVIEIRTGSDPFDRAKPVVGNYLDVDADGLPDYFELLNGYGPSNVNNPVVAGNKDADAGVLGPDGDRITDALEFALVDLGAVAPITARSDTDGDGLPDVLEVSSGSDFTNANSPLNNGGADTNNSTGPGSDGVSDALEGYLRRLGAKGAVGLASDSDGDRISDVLEVRSGTNPFNKLDPLPFLGFDVDGDGIVDVREVDLGTDPLDGDDPVMDGAQDTNDLTGPALDRLSDGLEGALISLGSSAPVSAQSDTDGDGIPDWLENLRFSGLTDSNSPLVNGGLDTLNTNGPAGDGISDALEALLVALGASIPVDVNSDSDGDGIGDVLEVRVGTNPFIPTDPAPNFQLDIDGDGAPDYLELTLGSDLLDANDPASGGAGDADLDRVLDGLEQAIFELGGIQPVGPSSDSDGDGLADVLEVALGSDFLSVDLPVAGGADTDDTTGPSGDGISDAFEFYLLASGAVAPVSRRTDQDLDLVPDYLEAMVGSAVANINSPLMMGGNDSDADLVSDALELVLVELGAVAPIDGTTDSDGDGAPDYLEARAGGLPFDATDPADGGAMDNDGDGLSDGLESLLAALGADLPITARTDSDNDSIPDYFEVTLGSDPFSGQNPVASGNLDVNDATGPSGDTLADGLEQVLIDAGSVAPVGLGNDTDSDGAPDYLEVIAFADAFDGNSPVVGGASDSDGDGLSDAVESVLLTLGAVGSIDITSDSDTDGALDYIELLLSGHPLDSNHPQNSGAGAADVDDDLGPPGDGISDALEALLAANGSPLPISSATDADADGVPDYLEVIIASGVYDANDPTPGGSADSNDATGPGGDGISDALEAYLISRGAVGPITTLTDSDGDFVPDWIEIYEGSDPFDPLSRPSNGTPPRAENVAVSGTLVIGRDVFGSYTYVDNDGDPEGATTTQWFRNNVLLPGETGPTLVVNPADIGASLRFEVTPVSDFAFPASSAVGSKAAASRVIPVLPFPVGTGGPGGVTVADGTGSLRMWLRPEEGVIRSLVGGTELVSAWLDSSGNGVDATANGSNPEYIADTGVNGQPALRFATESLEFDRPVQDNFTLFAVFATQSTSGQNPANGGWTTTPAIIGGEVATSKLDFHLGVNLGQCLSVFNDVTTTAPTIVNDNALHTIEVHRATGALISMYVDGFCPPTQALVGSQDSLDAADVLQLGASTPSQGFFQGDIFEVVIWDKTIGLTPYERFFLSNYIYGKYGIVPQTILYDQPVTHGGEIAGIGILFFTQDTRSAEGHGVLQFSNPTGFNDNDYLLWGTDMPKIFTISTQTPGAVSHRWLRTWALTETTNPGGDGVGDVDLRFRVGGLGLPTDAGDYALLMDGDLDFSNASVFTNGATYDPVLETISFTGFDPTGVTYITLGFTLP